MALTLKEYIKMGKTELERQPSKWQVLRKQQHRTAGNNNLLWTVITL